MKTIHELLKIISYKNGDFPSDFEPYKQAFKSVEEYRNRYRMLWEFCHDFFEKDFEDEDIEPSEKERFRNIVCASSFLLIQENIQEKEYSKALAQLQITLKKYVIWPYIQGNLSDEWNEKFRVLCVEEIIIWDNFLLSIFHHLKSILDDTEFLELLNSEIQYRNQLLEELEFPTGYEPVLAELKLLKKEWILLQTCQKIQEKTFLTLAQYDDRLLKKSTNTDFIFQLSRRLAKFPDKYGKDFFNELSAQVSWSNQHFVKLLVDLKTQLELKQKQINFFQVIQTQSQQDKNQKRSLIHSQIVSHQFYLFVFLKIIHSFASNWDVKSVIFIFENFFHIIETSKFLQKEEIQEYQHMFQEYFFESLSKEDKSQIIDLSSY